MNVATVCIPVHPQHERHLSAAIASVNAQTIPVESNVYFDKALTGAGAARNAAAGTVATPFVVFLDADDTLEPTFIEDTLAAYERGTYVYTGWTMGAKKVLPKARTPYEGKGYHLVTTLIPTTAYLAVGGFDETLPGYEDADLHLKLVNAGLCGKLVPDYLVNYSPYGMRSEAFEANPDKARIQQLVYERNGGKQTIMCCGQPGIQAASNPGEKQEGDVLAIALWGGLRTEVAASGRVYRGGNGGQLWVAKDDVEAHPKLFRRIFTVADLSPDKEDVLKSAGLL